MNNHDLKNKYTGKRLKGYKKCIAARNKFIEKEKKIRKDLEDCNRVMSDLNDKFEWFGNIP